MDRREWERDVQGFEASWWGDCANTFGEELKQVRAYAPVMGMEPKPWHGGDHWPKWDMEGRNVLDVGGGPVSMLLKCSNLGDATAVLDPCAYPTWTHDRYLEHGVAVYDYPAEDFEERWFRTMNPPGKRFDEAWCYNVLAHTLDPKQIVRSMRELAKVVRFFEWIDVPAHPGHPSELKADELAEWLGVSDDEKYHVWFDEQYREIDQGSESTVRQHAWGGAFT